ncbi:MAG TPA: MarR family transcriptional regulator [Clostridia bacterium]|jgi:DNA-binding MarR family transcriptional regulator|nr:MarR family transcriptional regulator [Clostridia bacterium]
MDNFSQQLNSLLVDTFRSILKVEEQMLKNHLTLDLSISEMHLIESVGKSGDEGLTISSIADDLSISLPSVTVAINKLQAKGYVEKTRRGADNRMVYVKLTRNGRRVDAVHQRFHETMVSSIASNLDEQEKLALAKGIIKLNSFFKDKLNPEDR